MLEILPELVQSDASEPGGQVGDSVLVKVISKQHPEYRLLRSTWTDLQLLYSGGWAIKANAELFLRRRPKELGDIYQARLANFTYNNHLGTALDWYASELFEEDPFIQSNAISTSKAVDLKSAAKRFYDSFFIDCDRAGTSFVDKFRGSFTHVLLYRKSFIVIDLPRVDDRSIATLDDEKRAGVVDDAGKKIPYLTTYSPLEAINWDLDAYGNLNWIIFETSQRRIEPKKIKDSMVHRWYYYDTTRFEVWEYVSADADEKMTPDNAMANLVAQGEHLLAKQRKIPVKQFHVPEGLWLANRAMLAAISHLNTDNVLDWALYMAALAMPVIMSDADITPTLSESGFIQLPANSKYEWTEPRGTSFIHLADRLQELTENIFRAFYLIHQGRSGRATPASQSGVSKQIDMMPSKDILKMFGDLLRAYMQQVLNLVSQARAEDLEWDVRGFEFKDDISLEEVQTIQSAKACNVPSDKFDKELDKRLAQAMLPDANRRVLGQIFDQIDKSPDRLKRQLNEMSQTMGARVDAINDNPVTVAPPPKGLDTKAKGGDAGPPQMDLKTDSGQ